MLTQSALSEMEWAIIAAKYWPEVMLRNKMVEMRRVLALPEI